MQNMDDIYYSIEQLLDIDGKLKYSEKMSEYYEMLSEEYKAEDKANIQKSSKFYNTSESLKYCHKLWTINYYRRSGCKVVEGVNRCKNKFCPNCIKLIQASHLAKLMPEIKKVIDNKYLYHSVFTVRSVLGSELDEIIDTINAAFYKLIRYFNGTEKIRGYSFEKFSFYAAVKAIECTYKVEKVVKDGITWYHPHFHVVFVTNEKIPSDLYVDYSDDLVAPEGFLENKFSFSRKDYDKELKRYKKVRYFHENTIFLQKLWRRLYDFECVKRREVDRVVSLNGKDGSLYVVPDNDISRVFSFPQDDPKFVIGPIDLKTYKKLRKYEKTIKAERVTIDKINSLNDGYSVTFDEVNENEYFEVFKYAFKFVAEEGGFMAYEQFKVLQNAFFGRNTLQAYGAWHGLKLDDKINEDIADAFKQLVNELNKIETPILRYEKLFDIIKSKENKINIVSKSSIHKYLSNLKDEN